MNVLPLGSYDMIICMDWLEKYKVIFNFFDKTFTYVDEDQIFRKVEGVIKPVSLRKIFSMQFKRFRRKACKMYAVRVIDLIPSEGQTQVKDHPILSKFRVVFLEEISELPPQREIDFFIETVLRYAPVSKKPYCMSIPELTELKI